MGNGLTGGLLPLSLVWLFLVLCFVVGGGAWVGISFLLLLTMYLFSSLFFSGFISIFLSYMRHKVPYYSMSRMGYLG